MQVVKNIQKHKSSILLVAEKAKKVENPYELAEPAERKRATRLAISILPLTIRKANWSMTLDLSHNTIDANGVENIMAVLPKEIDFGATALEKYRYNLEKLECAIQTKNLAESYTELGKKMCEDNFTSTNLDLSFFTAEKSIAPLCTPLRTSITIQSIHLSNCGIDDKKCIQIAAMLK